ncbi:hypothetical protein [Amycolatopsis saalfeldensis]|uniref:Uncharacterized protein n=1 Tax=Amycolatopsis saalfeldensis TaxID=394193 RepID=A0A1H8SZX2_9PSEU|nr:hypothetical protein [Amycolatopsis saalfeldensis]SEO84046.1 hypothetical protein SAMN04489732_102353 [Amycolatopsis saalfeldensis]
MTAPADVCAHPNAAPHETLVRELFPQRGEVTMAGEGEQALAP